MRDGRGVGNITLPLAWDPDSTSLGRSSGFDVLDSCHSLSTCSDASRFLVSRRWRKRIRMRTVTNLQFIIANNSNAILERELDRRCEIMCQSLQKERIVW